MEYKEVQRIKVGGGRRVLYDASTKEMVIMAEVPGTGPQSVDVTAECSTELRKSKNSSGHYVGIFHYGKLIFALGVDEKSKTIPFGHAQYVLEPAPGATVSFRITMRRPQHGIH